MLILWNNLGFNIYYNYILINKKKHIKYNKFKIFPINTINNYYNSNNLYLNNYNQIWLYKNIIQNFKFILILNNFKISNLINYLLIIKNLFNFKGYIYIYINFELKNILLFKKLGVGIISTMYKFKENFKNIFEYN